MEIESTTRVLVIDDDAGVQQALASSLTSEYEVHLASTGEEGLEAYERVRPALVLLDVMLPRLNGFDALQELRKRGIETPVIMLTARGQVVDKVVGLKLGADDYVTKPFSLRELTARVRAVLRRSSRTEEPSAINYRGDRLTADFDAVAVAVDGDQVRLTRREFELLRYLVMNKNRVVSRDRLLERVWGYDRQVETRSVDVHVGRLRNKLGAAGRQIETVVGLGYRFID